MRGNAGGSLEQCCQSVRQRQPDQYSTYGSDGREQIRLWGSAWGELLLFDNFNNDNTVVLSSGGGVFSDSGGLLTLSYSNNAPRVNLQAQAGGGVLSLRDGASQQRATLSVGATGGALQLHNTAGGLSIDLRSQFDAGNNAAWMGLDDNGAQKITFAARNGSTGAGGLVGVFNGSGTPTILLAGDDGTGSGLITTSVLQISGGSDLSEQFDVRAVQVSALETRLSAQPGMVVCIDPDQPGQLVVSSKPYDRTVAGIVSGAGGIKSGMLMGQQGTLATQRLYCRRDLVAGRSLPLRIFVRPSSR
jgi:hypothetical protein